MKICRRTMLRASGVAMALPWLEAMALPSAPRRRMVAINLGLGIHVPHLVPEQAGPDYALTPYLEPLADLRKQLTVISGTSHPEVDGGHSAEKSFLTTAPHPGQPSFRNTMSMDQLAAEKVGLETRYGFLALSLAGRGLSHSRSGVEIPSESRPSVLFSRLFLEGKADEKKRQVEALKEGRSVLDAVREEAKRLSGNLSAADRDKLAEYEETVREAERRLAKAQEWENRPKPKVDAPVPKDIADKTDVIGRARMLYDLIHLALVADSTRIVTFFKNGINAVPPVPGVTQDYHNLSHHGKDPAKIAELGIIEKAQMTIYADFLRKLRSSKEGDATLLDLTMVLIGSNLGNASSHDNRKLPIVLAGGGFRHGTHLAFTGERDHPLGTLFVSMLQRLGLEVDRFGSGHGTMRGLELI